MQALIQRVSRASVTVDGQLVGSIGRGFAVLLGVRKGDAEADARQLAHKTVNLRVFPDENDRMNLSLQDVGGEVLAISQFTLCANTQKGNRPSFIDAAPPDVAKAYYETYVDAVRLALGESRVAHGIFGARMTVEIVNDGPVTLELRSP